jgi:cytochrome P450
MIGTVAISIVSCVGLVWLWWRTTRVRRAGEAPYLSGHIPFLGVAVEFGHDRAGPTDYLRAKSEQNESTSTLSLHIAGERMTFLLNEKDVRVVERNEKVLDFSGFVMPLLHYGFGVDTRQFDRIKSTEKITHAQFGQFLSNKKSLADLTACFGRNFERALNRRVAATTASSREFHVDDLHGFVTRLVFEAAAESMFGDGWVREHPDAFGQLYRFDDNFAMLAKKVPPRLLDSGLASARAALSASTVDGKGSGTRAALIEAREAVFREHGVDEQAIGGLQMSILWAAVANTVASASWTVLHLAHSKEAAKAVRDEIAAVFGAANALPVGNMTLEQLDRLAVLHNCFYETLRRYDSAMVMRQVTADVAIELHAERDQVRPVSLRQGDFVCVFAPHFNLAPERFEAPLEWRLGRPELAKRVVVPFGCGSSQCPGRFWARNEIKMTVYGLLTRFDIELDGDLPEADSNGRIGLGMLAPRTAVGATLTPRKHK